MAEVQAHTLTAEEIHQSPLVQDERYELVDGRRRHLRDVRCEQRGQSSHPERLFHNAYPNKIGSFPDLPGRQ